MDYFKDNLSLTCKCGRKFRAKGWDRFGNERHYDECQKCHFEKMTVNKAVGLGSNSPKNPAVPAGN